MHYLVMISMVLYYLWWTIKYVFRQRYEPHIEKYPPYNEFAEWRWYGPRYHLYFIRRLLGIKYRQYGGNFSSVVLIFSRR